MQTSIGKVFVSHSSKDKGFVDQLVSDLTAHGIPVWYDKLEINIGDSVPGKINVGLFDAKYFLIVLSPDSINSVWVREELNAALMRQVISNGTFLIPILIKDCVIPPLLAHRRYADFRSNYQSGLAEVLSIWGKDARAIQRLDNMPLFPWPNLDVPDKEFVYVHSMTFDKFFRMNCEFHWTVDQTLDHIVETLDLPVDKEFSQLAVRVSFQYGLVFEDQSLSLPKTLAETGVKVGDTLQISVRGNCEDLRQKQSIEIWSGEKRWEISTVLAAQAELQKRIDDRGPLSAARLREIVDSCFDHLRAEPVNRRVRTTTIHDIDKRGVYRIRIEYPQLEGLRDSTERQINGVLKEFMVNKVQSFKDTHIARDVLSPNQLYGAYAVTLLSNKLFSVRMHFINRIAPAARYILEERACFNYRLHPVAPLSVYDLFKANLSHQQINRLLLKYCDVYMERIYEFDPDEISVRPTFAGPDDLKIFNLTDRSIIFSIHSWADHWWEAEIPYEEIKGHFDHEGVLGPYVV